MKTILFHPAALLLVLLSRQPHHDDNNDSFVQAFVPQSTTPRTATRLATAPTIYTRTLFRLQSDDDGTAPLVVEERLRYRPSADDPTFMEPFGPRTLVWRDGAVPEGALGDEFCVLHVHEVPPRRSASSSSLTTTSGHAQTLQHGGRRGTVDESIVTALILATRQPDACRGPVLELAAREGLGALMGCMGAAFGQLDAHQRAARIQQHATADQVTQDVLTVPTDHDKVLPSALTALTITETDPVMLDVCAAQVAGVAGLHKANVQRLDWRTRRRPPPSTPTKPPRTTYQTIVLGDTPLTYPETRAMVRTIAHRLAPSNPDYMTQDLYKRMEGSKEDKLDDDTSVVPRLVYVTKDEREQNVYFRQYLSQGCRMNVDVDYVTVEKIGFAIQSIATVPPSQEAALLDPLELEVISVEKMDYQVITAMHHPDYVGGGSGEIFFPMEATDFSVGKRGGGGGSGPEPEPARW